MIHSSKQLPGSGGAFDVVFPLLCHITVWCQNAVNLQKCDEPISPNNTTQITFTTSMM
jgi:hypothetical protein